MANNKAQPTPEETCKTWQIIYPVYLDKRKTVSDGRRVPKEKAVEAPTLKEIVDVCNYLGLKAVPEPKKCYSRDFFEQGRVRVLIKTEGKPVHAEIKTKGQLLLKLGELIPQLASRSKVTQAEQGGPKKKKKKGKK